jgi:hypothetical protein
MNYELNYESSKIIHLIHCGDLSLEQGLESYIVFVTATRLPRLYILSLANGMIALNRAFDDSS